MIIILIDPSDIRCQECGAGPNKPCVGMDTKPGEAERWHDKRMDDFTDQIIAEGQVGDDA